MLLPTLLVLSAAPVHVFVFSGDAAGTSPAQLIKKDDSGAKLIDASGIYALFHTGTLWEDFDAFTRPPPPGWPEPLAPRWKEAMKYCSGTLGPPPWKDAGAAMGCSRKVTEFLWQQYIALQHADRVYFVKNDGVAEVTASTFTPAEKEEHFILLKGHAHEDLGPEIAEAITALMKPDLLQRQPRDVIDALPVLTATERAKAEAPRDLYAGAKASAAPVKLAKQCDALPVSLSLSPTSVLSAAVENRWMASAKGRAPTASCTLELASHEEDNGPPMPKMTVITATLKCGTASAVAEAPAVALGKGKPVDLMTERLITGLAARYCH